MSDAVILELIKTLATLATVIIGGIISVRLGKLHKQINSRMDELIVQTQIAAKAEGKIEGKAEEKESHKIEVIETTTLPDAAKLKITGGEINVTSETKKRKL